MELVKFLTRINPFTLVYTRPFDLEDDENQLIYFYIEDLAILHKKINDTKEKVNTLNKIYDTFEKNILLPRENKDMDKLEYNLHLNLYKLSLEIDNTIVILNTLLIETNDVVDKEKLKDIIDLDKLERIIHEGSVLNNFRYPHFNYMIGDLERLKKKILKKLNLDQ